MKNNLAVVGFYYFQEAERLLEAIDEQMQRGLQLKGEYFLADAINIMLEHGLRMKTYSVDTWLDAGTPEALLETNRYLLLNGHDNSLKAARRKGNVIVPPVFVHPSACRNFNHWPVCLGRSPAGWSTASYRLHPEEEAETSGVILDRSGRTKALLQRRASTINAGDNTEVTL
jgi:glucose-1-phosphate thymidylyltransferase